MGEVFHRLGGGCSLVSAGGGLWGQRVLLHFKVSLLVFLRLISGISKGGELSCSTGSQ